MKTEEFFFLASPIKDMIPFAVSIAIIVVVFIYVRARAGSAGFLHDRLWRMLGGKKEYYDPILKNEYDRLSDHEKFNYNTGIRFSSQAKILEVLAWLKEREIGLEEVVRVRGFFDVNNIKFIKPRTRTRNAVSLVTILLFLCATLIFIISSLPAALLTIKKTGTPIWASPSIVTALNGYDWRVKSSDCAGGEIEGSKLQIHDQNLICEILTGKEANKKHLESFIVTQRLTGFSIWVLFGFFAILAARAVLVAKQAEALLERSLAHQPQKQLPLNAGL